MTRLPPIPADTSRPAADEKVFLISLGCAKNQVDSENLSASLRHQGFRFVADPAAAGVIVVNSCGFIRAAVEESLAVLGAMAAYKQRGPCHTLVLAGCLIQRFGQELVRQLPDTDLFLGMEAMGAAGPILSRHLAGRTRTTFCTRAPRRRQCPAPERVALASWAYIKVAEGCSNRCAYCTLPRIRGPLKSRPRRAIVREAASLARAGALEINLVAQDVAAYGRDRLGNGTDRLPRLLRELGRVEEVRWIRLLYCHPAHVGDGLVSLLGEHPKVCPYLDLPVQHVSASVLRRMNRPYTEDSLRRLIEKLRQARPDIALRTTVMAGFPGETEKDFERLLRFLGEARFHHLGVFPYSPEAGTTAWNSRGRQVSEAEKGRRCREVMRLQAGISRGLQRQYLGRTLEVLIEGDHDQKPGFVRARTRYQAPEVDGLVLLPRRGRAHLPPGLARARITATRTYDLEAELVPAPGLENSSSVLTKTSK